MFISLAALVANCPTIETQGEENGNAAPSHGGFTVASIPANPGFELGRVLINAQPKC